MAVEQEKPVILQIIPQLETGGAELSTLEIVQALRQAGARALVVTEGGRMAGEVERLGGELVLMPMASKNPFEMLRNKSRLERLVSEYNVALLHARSRAPAWSALLVASKLKIPFVTTYHGAYGEAEPFKRLYNSVMARGDRVIANSQFTADLVRARHAVDEKKLRVIYRGVDIERFSREAVSSKQRQALRDQWGVGREDQIFLHPARLTRWKGQGVVIRAMKELLTERPDNRAVLIIAGDHQGREDYLAELQRLIVENALQERIRLVGHCADMAVAYTLAHVTLIASIEPEAFGRTSAEAQAMGCPVIATNIGAPPETVRATPFVLPEERTGWLVPPDDAQALATIMQELLELTEEQKRKIRQNTIENVRHFFSDGLMKLQTLAVYDELLETDFARQFEKSTGLADLSAQPLGSYPGS